ncbi:cytochrome b5-related protein isoform X2 [Halyomorpha halys]|uniref:cytochrome b5-related protein isoform X2 n=1 Tax=Halyomorpha halys TaxID=286706 RepID=UPI0006D4DAC6|nr:cytochrome b5-related protein isoform X2 [Halyomorpha halys]
MNQDYSWRSYKEWIPPAWEGKSQTCQNWLETRKAEVKEENLWRIHDSLYDFSDFIKIHPGGSYWLEITKGTDITEAFESHHINVGPRNILSKYFIKAASTKRNAPFTFKEDGFYMTLRRRVSEKLKSQSIKPGPSRKSKMLIDSLCIITFLFAITAAKTQSYLLGVVAGLPLCLMVIAAHNFFHLRDNWRMYLFNLSFLTVRDWRISHAMSHHLYPNSLHDLEISMFEPWFQYLPRSDKPFTARFLSLLYFPIAYALIFYAEAFSRLLLYPDGLRELIPLAIPASMLLSGVPVLHALIWWSIIILSASFIFGFIGLNAAHHHPNIHHDGDEPREDRDWGLYQLDTVKDRVEIKGSFFLVLVLFGDHTLHHLFPTIDHAYLDDLYPELERTYKDFGIQHNMTTISDLIIGQFKQLARITRNKRSKG